MAALVWIVAPPAPRPLAELGVAGRDRGCIGTVVLTAAAGARRTDSAYGRFLAASNAADVAVAPDNTGFGGYYPALAKLPGVEAMAPVIGVWPCRSARAGEALNTQVYASADERFGHVVERPRFRLGATALTNRVHEVALDVRRLPPSAPRSAAASPWQRRNRHQHQVEVGPRTEALPAEGRRHLRDP